MQKPIIVIHNQTIQPAAFTKTDNTGNLGWWHTVILNASFNMAMRIQALNNVNKTLGLNAIANEQGVQDYIMENNIEIG